MRIFPKLIVVTMFDPRKRTVQERIISIVVQLACLATFMCAHAKVVTISNAKPRLDTSGEPDVSC